MFRLLPLLLLGACSVAADPMPAFDGVDLHGSDLKKFRTKSGLESECRDACLAEDKCVAYTFGTKTAVKHHRGRCYLKRPGFEYRLGKTFRSAIKK